VQPRHAVAGGADPCGPFPARATDVKQETVKQVKSFKQAVEAKSAEEKQHVGWKSTAFDLD
jgi:hypothetical protein